MPFKGTIDVLSRTTKTFVTLYTLFLQYFLLAEMESSPTPSKDYSHAKQGLLPPSPTLRRKSSPTPITLTL